MIMNMVVISHRHGYDNDIETNEKYVINMNTAFYDLICIQCISFIFI